MQRNSHGSRRTSHETTFWNVWRHKQIFRRNQTNSSFLPRWPQYHSLPSTSSLHRLSIVLHRIQHRIKQGSQPSLIPLHKASQEDSNDSLSGSFSLTWRHHLHYPHKHLSSCVKQIQKESAALSKSLVNKRSRDLPTRLAKTSYRVRSNVHSDPQIQIVLLKLQNGVLKPIKNESHQFRFQLISIICFITFQVIPDQFTFIKYHSGSFIIHNISQSFTLTQQPSQNQLTIALLQSLFDQLRR